MLLDYTPSSQEKINESHEWEITYSGPRKFVFPPVITRMGCWDASHTGIDFHIDGKLYKSHTLFTVGMFNFPRISKYLHTWNVQFRTRKVRFPI